MTKHKNSNKPDLGFVLFCGTNKTQPQVKLTVYSVNYVNENHEHPITSTVDPVLWLFNPKLEGNSCLVRRCTKWFVSEITSLPTPFDHLRQTFGNVFQLGLSVFSKRCRIQENDFLLLLNSLQKNLMTIVCEIGTPFKKYENCQSNSKISNRNADCRSRSTWLFAPIVDFTMVPSTP